jgi:hypothetical protein
MRDRKAVARITGRDIHAAQAKVQRTKFRNRGGLIAKVFRQQPALLSFVAGLSCNGLPADRIAFLYDLVTVCVQAVNEAGGAPVVNWSEPIGEDSRRQSALSDFALLHVRDFLSGRGAHNSDSVFVQAAVSIVQRVTGHAPL